ncbi:MAG TPA: hypothetical protein PLL10_00815, partial [Elusimicrobiales bacterium]|nr:hypothetical protein [Elusimicrobiales bacterium]
MMQKLLKTAAVVFIAALLLELALQAFGFVASQAMRRRECHSAGPGRTILCMGDCMVMGVGGRPFPEQLQEILREKYGPQSFTVINDGKAAGNSSYVAANLPKELEKYNPSLVIVMTGRNNDWNPFREGEPGEEAPWLM